MVANRQGDSVDITLRSYETAAQRYADKTAEPSPALCAFLDLFADAVGLGRVLEVGSGPGMDAEYLERRGLNVSRTDATRPNCSTYAPPIWAAPGGPCSPKQCCCT